MGHSRPLFLYFRLFNTVNSECSIQIFANDWINHGPLELEATVLPTEPQPLHKTLLGMGNTWNRS